jgi:hypothetical protein
MVRFSHLVPQVLSTPKSKKPTHVRGSSFAFKVYYGRTTPVHQKNTDVKNRQDKGSALGGNTLLEAPARAKSAKERRLKR